MTTAMNQGDGEQSSQNKTAGSMLAQTGGTFSASIISDSPPVKKIAHKDHQKLRPTAGALRSNPLYASRPPFERATDTNQSVERPGQIFDRSVASTHNAANKTNSNHFTITPDIT